MKPGAPLVQVCDVTHHYGVWPVLLGVQLEIQRGEVVAVMGPNGMGKSTLLALVAGIMLPMHGHVAIDGVQRRADAESERAIRRRVAYLPADTWLPPAATGRDYLLSIGRLYRVNDNQLMDHIDRLIHLFQLDKQVDMRTNGYSTGQKRKLAVAGALVSEAPLLVLDEPFGGGLDPAGIVALRKVLQHLASRDDVTILFATPVPEIVEGLADRVAVLSEGRLIACDTCEGLRKQTGCEGSLQEVLERLLNREEGDRVEAYFRGAES